MMCAIISDVDFHQERNQRPRLVGNENEETSKWLLDCEIACKNEKGKKVTLE